MRLLIAATIVAASASGTALAQDYYGSGDPYPKCFDKSLLAFVDCNVEYGYYDWNGWYVGLHAGYADLDLSGGVDDLGAAPVSGSDLDTGGFAGGAQIGYNLDVGNFVFGLEVDGSLADAKDSATVIGGGANNTLKAKINGFGSVRARVGVPIDEFLPFITAGAGLVDYEVEATKLASGVVSREEETAFAGVIGGGLEIGLFEDVTVRGEGLYYYIDESFSVPDGAGADTVTIEDLWTLRGAVNMRF